MADGASYSRLSRSTPCCCLGTGPAKMLDARARAVSQMHLMVAVFLEKSYTAGLGSSTEKLTIRTDRLKVAGERNSHPSSTLEESYTRLGLCQSQRNERPGPRVRPELDIMVRTPRCGLVGSALLDLG